MAGTYEDNTMNMDSILLVIAAITGIVGMPIIQWIKTQFKVDANWALLIATVVSLVLGFLVAILGGQIAMGEAVTLESVVQSATIVFSISSVFYKVLLGDKK